MIPVRTLSAMFRSGDIGPFRRRHLVQYWVVNLVKDDPVRCVRLYRALLADGGAPHAAELFLELLDQARTAPLRLWWHAVRGRRAVVPLPA